MWAALAVGVAGLGMVLFGTMPARPPFDGRALLPEMWRDIGLTVTVFGVILALVGQRRT